MLAGDESPFREAHRGIDRKINGSGGSIEDHFGHAQTDRGGRLESRAAESAIEPEALGADGTERGMLVGGDAVVAAMRGVKPAIFHERDALAEAVDGLFHEALAGVVGVAIRGFAEWIPIFQADERQSAFGAEVQAGWVDDQGTRRQASV